MDYPRNPVEEKLLNKAIDYWLDTAPVVTAESMHDFLYSIGFAIGEIDPLEDKELEDEWFKMGELKNGEDQ